MNPSFGKSKVLDPDAIAGILKKAEQNNTTRNAPATLWPKRDDFKLLLAAIHAGDKRVTLSEGREYIILRRNTLQEPSVYIKPSDTAHGFTPCGDFRISWLETKVKEYNG